MKAENLKKLIFIYTGSVSSVFYPLLTLFCRIYFLLGLLRC